MRKNTKPILIFLVRFLGLFALLFYGTEAVIGLSTPENSYSPFVARYLDFIAPFRHFLLLSVQWLVGCWDYKTQLLDAYSITVLGGKAVYIGYDCIGYGLVSFWIAFIFANRGSGKKKGLWMLMGCMAFIIINLIRISFLLIAINKSWPIPLGWDHHTWFNIVAYLLIFFMIYIYDRTGLRSRENTGMSVETKKEKMVAS